MAIKIDSNMSAVAYHIVDGPQDFPYAVDAQSAVGRHPLEWSMSPWSADAAAAARKRMSDQYARDAEVAKSRGLPPPIAPAWLDAEPVELTADEQAAIDEHAKAVAEANERLKARREKLAAERAEADQVAADEALVASPPPRPDPAAPRPLTKKEKKDQFLQLTPEEQAEKDAREKAETEAAAKKASDAKLAQDKAAADKLAAASQTTTATAAAAKG
jgi:hypothetical protein